MMTPAPDSATAGQNPTAPYVDPRDTPAFREVDHLVHNFVDSFPKGLRDPVRDGVVDIHLLLAILAPYMCVNPVQGYTVFTYVYAQSCNTSSRPPRRLAAEGLHIRSEN